jgi:branched-chain amino acid transport system ATP-binding protein
LEIRNLSKSFQGLQVFSGIDLTVEDRPGEKSPLIGVIGPNGAGKTTLFNIFTGYAKADGGSVIFDGKELLGKKPHEIVRAGLTRTFQSTLAFRQLTVKENVLVAAYLHEDFSFLERFIYPLVSLKLTQKKTRDAQERAEKVLSMVGMLDDMDMVSGNLPYGKQKKLGIAMGLATEPKLLALDEPAAGLNPHETAETMELLQEINRGGTAVLVIEHNMKLIMTACERIYVLSGGRIIAEGLPQEIAKNERVIEVYLGKGMTAHA